MAAPRATQFLALRNLSRSATQQQVRNLHMTGPATYASPLLAHAQERPTNLPGDTAGLRAECKRRRLDAAGPHHELLGRLRADDLAQSRAFSSVAESARPRPAAPSSAPQTRHFNTSRSLKAVKDSSTIDFAYLPSAGNAQNPVEGEILSMRMPLLPDTELTRAAMQAAATALEAEAPVMRAEISSTSADAVILPMAELSDDHAMHVDFHAVTELVSSKVRSIREPVEQHVGLVRQVWGDLVDDVLGARRDGKMPSSVA